MACCAFALYLLTRLLAPVHWLRERLLGVPIAVASTSVAWEPGRVSDAVMMRNRWRPMALAVVAAEIVVVGLAISAPASAAVEDAAILAQFHRSLCSAVFGGQS